MNLTDMLHGAGFAAKVGLIVYGFKKLIVDKYIPYAERLQEKCDLDEKENTDDYNFFKRNEEKK
jgi:hypothetical protein